jgi:hypothetical protein
MNGQITGLVNNFVAQVAALARQAALQTLEGALSKGSFSTPSPRATNGKGPRRAPTLAMPKLPKGAKRPAEQLEAIKGKLLEHIQANPGQRVEQINQALGTATKDLALPIKKLLADGAIKSEGEKRATAYFPKGRKA